MAEKAPLELAAAEENVRLLKRLLTSGAKPRPGLLPFPRLLIHATVVCAVAGFFGASSMERLPTELAITRQVAAFKSLSLRPAG